MNARTISHASLLTIAAALAFGSPALAARDNGNGYQGGKAASLASPTKTNLVDGGPRFHFRPDRGTDLGTKATQLHKGARPDVRNDATDVAGTATSLTDFIFAAWYRWAVSG